MKNLIRFFALILLSLSAQLTNAQSSTELPSEILSLNHIAVYVHNLEKSTAFYDSVLHLKKIPEPFKDGLHTWYSLSPAGNLHLIQGADKDIKRNKNDHLCFSVGSVENFITNLERQKIEYYNWPGKVKEVTTRVDGVKQIYFQDPDGHWIEINNERRGK